MAETERSFFEVRPDNAVIPDVAGERWLRSMAKGRKPKSALSVSARFSRSWPDAFSILPTPHRRSILVSQAIRDYLVTAGFSGVIAPVEITLTPKSRPRDPPSEYFFVAPEFGLEIDEEASRLEVPFKLLVPIASTWSREVLFAIEACGGVFCSEEFVDAKVESKWRGLEFHPIDVATGMHFGWDGMKTNKKTWRETMRPPELDPGRIPEMIKTLGCSTRTASGRESRYEARLFLLNIGQLAVAPLVEVFRSGKDGTELTHQAADVLRGLLTRGIGPVELLDEVKDYCAQRGL